MSVEKSCWGCREDQPNQLAHMDPGGCLYEPYTTCEGCRNDDLNELAHMEPGGCLNRPRYSLDEYSDEESQIISVVINEPKEAVKKVVIDTHSYYYDTKTKILYTDKNLKKKICKYDEVSGKLIPLSL